MWKTRVDFWVSLHSGGCRRMREMQNRSKTGACFKLLREIILLLKKFPKIHQKCVPEGWKQNSSTSWANTTGCYDPIEISYQDLNLLHWHWVANSLVTHILKGFSVRDFLLIKNLDEDVNQPGGEASATLLLLVDHLPLLPLLQGGRPLQQALPLIRPALPLEHAVLQLSALRPLQRNWFVWKYSFPIVCSWYFTNLSGPQYSNNILPINFYNFSHQIVQGWVHGVQVVAALPVLDALHSWIVRVEPFVQVLRENLMSFYQMSLPDICRERRKRF